MRLRKGWRGANSGTFGRYKCSERWDGREEACFCCLDVQKGHGWAGYCCGQGSKNPVGVPGRVVFFVQPEMFQVIGTQIRFNGQRFAGSGISYPIAYPRNTWALGTV